MKQITDQTEFIIGIDFGHGETSASFYSLQSNCTESKKDLNITPGKNVIKSAVAILRQEGVETIAIGDRAIQEAPSAENFRISFKKRPSEMDDDDRKLMVKFMKGVYDGILDQYPDYKTREHVIYIARPSQDKLWKDEEPEYIKIAEEAGLPVAGIQKESRAAYFRARTKPDSKIDNQIDEGVLIVDFGSSTIDFTYLNKDLKKPIDDGVNLGASAVEETLLQYSLLHPMDDDPNLAEFYKLYDKKTNAYNQLLYKFRVAKESFYENNQSRFGLDYRYNYLTSAEEIQLSGRGGVEYSRAEVRRILTEEFDKYIPKVEAAVCEFRDQKLKGNKVACVYLTGGASQMDFVREIFMKVFNLSAKQCPKDEDASVIVSQGVAHLSYADYRTQKKEKELSTKAKKIIDSFDWDGKIKKIILADVKQSIIDKAKYIMVCYKNGSIYDYHNVKDGYENGILYNIGLDPSKEKDEGYTNRKFDGLLKYRNIEALIKRIKSEFGGFTRYDFGTACEEIIKKQLLSLIYTEIQSTFVEFGYDAYTYSPLTISGLSARLSSNGADYLCRKFTDEGDGHIIYNAVSSCWMTMMGWDKYKDRTDKNRKQHYDYYMNNKASIFDTAEWATFLNDNVTISGISTVKAQVKDYVENMIKEYISYAKLAIFF